MINLNFVSHRSPYENATQINATWTFIVIYYAFKLSVFSITLLHNTCIRRWSTLFFTYWLLYARNLWD